MRTRVNNAKSGRDGSASRTGETQPAQLWSLIIDKLPDAISVHSSSGEILWVNRTLCEILNKPASELNGLSCDQVFHVGGSLCPHDRLLAGGESMHLDQELRMFGKTFSVTLELLADESNQPRGFVRVMRDVTGEWNAREQLLKAERFATLGQLFSGVAHDVGTPLNVISGYAEFLLMRKSPEDQGYKELSSILAQTRRIASIFGQALELARPAQGRKDAIDLNALVSDSLSLAGPHLRKVDVTADLTCRIPTPLIYGEAPQLKQACFNLLLNAVHQIGAGGKLRIVIDQMEETPAFLSVILEGTEATGAEHDFAMSLGRGLDPEGAAEVHGIGLYLTRGILREAGARTCSTQRGEQGKGLMIHFPRTQP